MVVSVHPPQHFARRALAVGALGYLEKNAPPEEMVKAVTQVLAARGERFHLFSYQVDGEHEGHFVHRDLAGSIRIIDRPENIH